MNNWQRILSVARRELRIVRNRPLYFMGSIGVIAFCAIFFLTFLDHGLPDDIPIGVVDEDYSTTSRNFCQQLDATQLGKVVHYDSFSSAREDMTSGKIAGVCVIPEGMNEDIQAFRQPKITFYVNGLYFVSGALAWKDLLTMVNLTNGAVQREVLRAKGFNDSQIMGLIRPIDIDTHQIGNVTTNYNYYLSGILLPGVLEMIVILVLIYSLGAELKFGTSRHLMEYSGHSVVTALTGKLLVWTLAFSVIGFVIIMLLYHWLHFPISGSIFNMFIAMFLMILASEAIGVFILEMLPDILVAANHCLNNDQHLRKMVKDRGVKVVAGAKVTNITPDSVTYEKDGETFTIACDTVLNAAGFRANDSLEEACLAVCDDVAVVGDAVGPRKILDAIHEGYHAIRVME